MYDLICNDVIKWTSTYDGPLFHALLSDPPYHLTSIVKRFGKRGSAPAKPGKDGAFSRVSRGFLGQSWDGGDIAFQPETWSALMNVMHPGAFGFAFSGRYYYKLALALEQAGAILHPSLFGWVQGQSLPKATQIANPDQPRIYDPDQQRWILNPDPRFKNHRYGGQVLKSALEPIICFQKPYQHKPQIDIIETGAGALNIGKGRLAINPQHDDPRLGGKGSWSSEKAGYQGGFRGDRVSSSPDGRWPSNFYTDLAGAEKLDQQSGVKSSGMMKAGTQRSVDGGYSGSWPDEATHQDTFADRGGVSRFFYIVQEKINEADPVFYAPKVKGKEKEAGLDHREPVAVGDGRKRSIDNGFQRGETLRRNNHPTPKPISLCRYLASLLLPPDDYAPRRILVPFAGVASEMIGATKSGWEEVVGVELMEEYVSIGKDRLAFWSGTDPDQNNDARQLTLFGD